MNAINMYPDEILIVDDTYDNLRLLEDILNNAGYRVRLANDGDLALRSARIQPPALILLDIRMPGMDGYEVCRRLKADERTRSIPVIFLSILEDEREKVKAFHAGCVDYINKPIHDAEVLARVHTHLALRHAQLELEARNAELETARDTLEEKVRERSAELEQANLRLQQQIEVNFQTLETLRKSESKYRQLVDTANEGIWMLGPDLMTTFVNERMAEMIGYSPEQLIGRPFTDFMFEEDVPDHHARMEKRRQGMSESYERRIRHKDGKTVWAHLSATVIIDEKHRFQGTFAMFTDITERKRMQEVLQKNEKRYRIVADNTYDWEFWLSPDGKFLYNSPSCERITGQTLDEFARESDLLNRIIHPDDREVFMRHQEYVTAEKLSGEIEFRVLCPDGSTRHIGHVCQPIFDEQGQYLGNRGSNRDITERKQAEEEVRILNRELEQRVADRTSQLEAANRELEAFSYSVSHDLRAPLRHIYGFLELLQQKAGKTLDEQSRHYMDTIFDAANKMGVLIDDLLAFSRMGRHAMSFQQVDLEPLVRDIIRELEPDIAGRDIAWRIGDLPTVGGGDAAMLRIVLSNLIANALKFTRPRQQARIEIGSLSGQDSETVVYVRDNGVGFDMTYAGKLFGVFQRLHRADEFEGTGIGLATVRRIIARHGGRTWAEGKVDQGAAFYFSLPQAP